MIPDDDGGDTRGGDAELLIHLKKQGLVGGVMVDFELLKAERRVPGLYFCNEWFYLITMAATLTVKIIPGDREV
jgi:hypothetical protein